MGEIVTLLRTLAEHAMRSGAEKISEEMLKRDFLHKIGWVRPSDRTRISM